jgi:hypothetical protein
MKREKIEKNNKVNDITYKKFVDVFQSLQKITLLCKYQGKWKIQTPMLEHVTYVSNKQQVGNTSKFEITSNKQATQVSPMSK